MPKGKKKDVKKTDVKKKDSKTADSEKAEESVHTPDPAQDTTAESGLTGLPDLQSDSVNAVGETQATPEIPEEVEEPPVQPIPQYREEPILAQLIVKSYEGELVNGLYEGEGFARFEGGDTYKGTFSEGFMHGQGTYTWADGVKYEGTFAENVQMFSGRYTWNDGSVYEGSIKDGIRHGFGFFRSGTRPISYLGEWCNGKRHGNGIIYFDEEHTSWYSGEWANNVREGWGMRRYKSGNTYEGQWKKNVRHGHGRMIWLAAKQEYVGQWVNGIQHGYGTHVWFFERSPLSQYPLRNEYVGDFVQGKRHGQGKFIYASGALYEGQWVRNKKHGWGKFVFKNGRAYEGEFVDDCLVEGLHLQVNEVNAKEPSAVGTHSVIENITIINDLESTSILGSDIRLDISSLLDLFPEEERQEELHQVECAVLRHMTILRRIYKCYSALGCIHSPDNTFLMTQLQFWRFLKDCKFHHSKITLAEMDRVLGGGKGPLEIHCPHHLLLFRTFLSYLIHLAFRIYHKKHKEKGRSLDNCFSEMMSRNVIPTACCVQGILFSEERHTVFAMSYIDKCWEIYRAFYSPSLNPPFEPTMKIRQFVWMLDDLKLLNKQLTVSRLVKIFVKVGASPRRTGINMELELVFLEFFEALLECAVVYVTHDMVKEEIAHDNQNRASFRFKNFFRETSTLYSGYSQPLRPCEDKEQCQQASLLETVLSFAPACADSEDDPSLSSWDAGKEPDSSPAKELGDEAKEDKTEQHEEFCLWMYQVEIFFTTKLFPAYQQEKVLRQKVGEKQKEDVELAELRKIKDVELAKLIAEREAEEVRRQEAAAAEQARASLSADTEASEDPVPQEVSPRKGSRARLSKGEAQKKDAHRKDSSQNKEAQKKAPSVKKEAAPAGNKGPANKKNKPSGKNP
ncbi:radial spoke head 10 homolog B2-like isoform X2 [Neopelma chrysocephalum]|uniref:radial spoke head 10 homolog B2-like isoform X2 n=1 Tax=Neopelma chrysocephalum TaxID=114329 RepID=UPI000FCCE699|nr:radial spoke head 10 homolog B2-like isoform X2 [Neopelma chrysocephalum]